MQIGQLASNGLAKPSKSLFLSAQRSKGGRNHEEHEGHEVYFLINEGHESHEG